MPIRTKEDRGRREAAKARENAEKKELLFYHVKRRQNNGVFFCRIVIFPCNDETNLCILRTLYLNKQGIYEKIPCIRGDVPYSERKIGCP